jgi:two-component system, NtrC family, response regulator AtoC
LSDRCLTRLREYHWPGNIRQLENLIKRYVVLGSEDAILVELNDGAADIVKFTMPSSGQISLKQIKRQATRQLERKVILKIVEASGWNRKKAAERLNISYRALLYKLKEVGVPLEHQRARNTSPTTSAALDEAVVTSCQS